MVITFNKSFYNLPAIKKAIKDYYGLANFKIKNDKKNHIVVLDKINPEAEKMIEDEFSNYVLAVIKDEQQN